ncbi:MAG TPA: MFS transporter [Candidatus Olsenella excrementavium]|uniref:MFS transporter n=1 Tax=Candidatus Olsenella excrementavium TaxID=2838709 RepID=A0A9D1ZAG4_9ACTN|nr:MFS transporter [Candidatus Olsenella excrementavium]
MSQSAFLIAVVSLQNLGFNLVHPVTPTFIGVMGMQDWIFGVSYAAMALTSFLFSKEAGELCLRFESKAIFAVGCFGYAAMQLMFLASTNESQVILWRLLSGFFVAMINVASLVFLVKSSDEGDRARNLTYLATATAVTTALGYTAGGLIGNSDYVRAFYSQTAVLVAAGLLLVMFGKRYGTEHLGLRRLVRDGNPLKLSSQDFHVRRRVVAYLSVVLISISALTIYEQSLNYYLKDALGYTPADIGYLKGAIGVVTLVANQLIALRLVRRAHLLRNIGIVFGFACVTNVLFTVMNMGPAFVACNLAFTIFNAMHLPMVQELVTSASTEHQGELVSLYNEMKSIGWVVGGLVAGVAYAAWPLLPFVITLLLFGGLMLMCLKGDQLQQRYRRD